jgi:hypothetical protein
MLALALVVLFTSTAWALFSFDSWEARCQARDHRRPWHAGVVFRSNEACAAAVAHAKRYPKHKPYVVYSDGEDENVWDCTR